jgi:hypothetical protein
MGCGLGKFSSSLFGSGWSVWLWYRPRSSRSGRVEWMRLGGLCWVAPDKIGKLYVSSPSCFGLLCPDVKPETTLLGFMTVTLEDGGGLVGSACCAHYTAGCPPSVSLHGPGSSC